MAQVPKPSMQEFETDLCAFISAQGAKNGLSLGEIASVLARQTAVWSGCALEAEKDVERALARLAARRSVHRSN